MLNWQCHSFKQLTTDQLYHILKVRQDVFVVEQNCVYADIDTTDRECLHLMATTDAGGLDIAAYLRIVPPGVKYTEASLGRILTTEQARGTGAGQTLVTNALEILSTDYPADNVKISAQAYLQKFYKSFGFKNISEIYDEDGIDHIDMLLTRN